MMTAVHDVPIAHRFGCGRAAPPLTSPPWLDDRGRACHYATCAECGRETLVVDDPGWARRVTAEV